VGLPPLRVCALGVPFSDMTRYRGAEVILRAGVSRSPGVEPGEALAKWTEESNASNAHYLPTGHLVFAHAGTLMAVPFELKSLSVTGPPVQVVHELLTNPDDGYGVVAVARSGSLVYVSSPEHTGRGGST